MSALLTSVQNTFSRFDRTYALAIFRIVVGLNVLFFYYLQRTGQAMYLWGPNGVVPHRLFLQILAVRHDWSLYAFTPNQSTESLMLCAGALVTLAFTIGLCTRVSTVLFYIFTWSLFSRNPLLLDGGDNLLYLLAFYLMFTDCGRRLSVDNALGLRRATSPFIALFHQIGVCAMVAQVALLYFTSGMYKIQGHTWQSGTAIYYVLRSNEFALDSWTHYIYNSAWLGPLLSYGTFIFQIAFPFLIFHKRLKWLVIPIAISFHIGIAWTMGLMSFSLNMLAAEALFLTDDDYRMLFCRVRALVSRPREVPAAVTSLTASDAAVS